VLLTGTVSPFVSLYPLYHPYRRVRAEQVDYPVGYRYIDAGSDANSEAISTEIAELIGYNLPQPYAKPGSYTPIELCWRPLGRTEEPYAVFVHLLEASQLSTTTAPSIWGGRRSHPGLGNLPTDRWALDEPFCDRLLVPVSEDTPAPLGTVIEVGFIEADSGTRLSAYIMEDGERERVGLPVIGGLAIVSEADISRGSLPATYTLGSAIALHRVTLSEIDAQELRVALTWQARQAVPYDAIIFAHVVDAGGGIISQVDRQPLDGRFPTYYWVPGQVLTETFTLSLPVSYQAPLHVNLGMYVWPSMERLPVVDATGEPQPDNLIRLDSPE
jgi:hypothetical protein